MKDIIVSAVEFGAAFCIVFALTYVAVTSYMAINGKAKDTTHDT
jgi:integral membrane sensor domain MASE1